MVGVPGETDDDIDELVTLARALSRRCRVSLGVAPFVSKRNTPLDGLPFAGIAVVDARLRRLRAGLRGGADVRPVSPRWAWVECLRDRFDEDWFVNPRTGPFLQTLWALGQSRDAEQIATDAFGATLDMERLVGRFEARLG
jgi:hypothetical protein